MFSRRALFEKAEKVSQRPCLGQEVGLECALHPKHIQDGSSRGAAVLGRCWCESDKIWGAQHGAVDLLVVRFQLT